MENLNFEAIKVVGKDALDFLQRITTVNCKKLEVSKGAKGLVLEANSKVIASFTMLRLSADDFLLHTDTLQMDSLFGFLEKVHFSENLIISREKKRSALIIGEEFPGIDHDVCSDFFSFQENSNYIRWPVPVENVSVVWGDSADFSEKEISDEEWNFLRVKNKIPAFGFEFTNNTMALDAGLAPWIHENKGCYPGQEVVERSLSIGHPSKVLVKIKCSEHKINDDLIIDDKKVGKITSIAGNGTEKLALALVQWNAKEIVEKIYAPS